MPSQASGASDGTGGRPATLHPYILSQSASGANSSQPYTLTKSDEMVAFKTCGLTHSVTIKRGFGRYWILSRLVNVGQVQTKRGVLGG